MNNKELKVRSVYLKQDDRNMKPFCVKVLSLNEGVERIENLEELEWNCDYDKSGNHQVYSVTYLVKEEGVYKTGNFLTDDVYIDAMNTGLITKEDSSKLERLPVQYFKVKNVNGELNAVIVEKSELESVLN